jgi:hypothetical protein
MDVDQYGAEKAKGFCHRHALDADAVHACTCVHKELMHGRKRLAWCAMSYDIVCYRCKHSTLLDVSFVPNLVWYGRTWYVVVDGQVGAGRYGGISRYLLVGVVVPF